MKKIGWIGTGIMGKSMAGHLIKSGHELMVFNRTASKAADLVKMGATYMDTPREVAANADYMFLMLGHPHDVQTVIYDPKKGILDSLKAGTCLIDHTSSSPSLAMRMYYELKMKGV